MNNETIAAAKRLAPIYKVPAATVLGVVEQESNGVVYASIGGHSEPIIRWEGHYFFKRLRGAQLDKAVKAGLASPRAGGVPNPASQQDRWSRLILPAMSIDKQAAIESCSWGVGQVMGAHWEKLGFKSAEEFADKARSGVEGQMRIMLEFCKMAGLIDELQRGDFVGFTRGYNGTGNVASYSASMKRKVQAWAKKLPENGLTSVAAGTIDHVPVTSPSKTKNAETMLRLGVTGARVRELQELLLRAGLSVGVDGDFGPATERVVEEFQRRQHLDVDGIAGPQVMAALDQFKVDPAEQAGAIAATEAVTKTSEGQTGGIAAGGGVGIIAAKEAVQNATDSLYGSVGSGGIADKIYVGLTILGALLTVAGLAYVAYGWWRANHHTSGVKEA